jgi:putative transposase
MKKHHTEAQILGILKEAEQGKPLPEVLRAHGIASGTFYRWKSKYGGLEPSQLHLLKKLERENNELKKIVADQALDNAMLRELSRGNF